MAILRSVYLKGASQKLGGVVLYQSQGRTLARELAPSVSNPRTPSQMEQRVKLANVVAVYRANRTWMPGAFEDKKQNESDYNAFVGANLANSLVATSKSEAAAGAAVVAPYKISSGSLPSIEHNVQSSSIVTNLYVGNLTISGTTTIGQLSTALINNNAGIREGMQLSLIINLQQVQAGTLVPYIILRAYELLINTTSTELLSKYMPVDSLSVSGGADSSLSLNFATLGVGACSFIISETTGGKTRVSTQSLTMFGVNPTYQQYTSTAAWNAALISYGEGEEAFLSSKNAYGQNTPGQTISIVGIEIGDEEYVPGGEYNDTIRQGDSIVLALSSPIPSGATVTMATYSDQNVTRTSANNVVVAADGMSVSGAFGTGYGIGVSAVVYIVLTINGVEFTTNIRLVSGDIS